MFKLIATLFATLPVVAATGTIVCSNEVVDFNVMDVSVKPPIFTDLTPTVDLLDFPTCALNIEATIKSTPSNCDEQTAKCVKFFLDGAEINKEKFAPFTLFPDRDGGFSSRKLVGVHKLKACTYSDKACTMGESGCKEVEVDFLDCDRPGCDSVNEVTSFSLVDTESPYKPVVTPFTPPVIDLLDFPTCALNVYANISPNTCGDAPIKCVKLTLGSQVRKEVEVPWALYGNTGRFIRSGKPALGAQTLKACTYTDVGCSEGESGCLDVDVFVKDCVDMSMSM